MCGHEAHKSAAGLHAALFNCGLLLACLRVRHTACFNSLPSNMHPTTRERGASHGRGSSRMGSSEHPRRIWRLPLHLGQHARPMGMHAAA